MMPQGAVAGFKKDIVYAFMREFEMHSFTTSKKPW